MTSSARDFPPGERVPGTIYQVIRRIGGGGMGTVYDVEDTTIGKRYVLKALLPQLGAREDLARRMRNEARTLARLNHPNIVEVITAGITDDDLRLPYYVMERLNGQSLRVVLEKKGQLELPHAVHITIDLLDALDHAHDKGVIHRDVKPDNIFLHRTPAGVTVTKLLDFGIVSLLDGAGGETAGRFLGTLRYAAPEQLRGDKPTAKMDVYCAGLVLYEMIAGRGPFDDQGDSNKIASAHLNRLPPPLSAFAAVPPELEKLVAASLQKRPDERPRDAFSFAASLRNLKRTLAPVRGHESTENRATAPEVSGAPDPAPVVEVRLAAPGGPYVVSPAPAAPQPAAPRTTLKGLSAHAAAEPVQVAATPTTLEAVDRGATTGVVAEAARGPSPGGTEAYSHVGPAAPAVDLRAAAPVPPPLHWPAERPAARSEEPHVMSPARPPRALLALSMGLGSVLALAATAALVVVIRSRQPDAPRLVPAAAPTPVPVPVFTVPAPTLALPPLEDTVPSSRPPRALPATPAPAETRSSQPPFAAPPTTPAVPTGRPAPPLRPTPPRAPAPAPAMPDKPGPGF